MKNYLVTIKIGKVRLEDGRWFDTGLPPGHPDLYGFRIGDGKVFYIEVKTATGRPRPDQITFHKMLNRYGIIHGIARSADDAVKRVDRIWILKEEQRYAE